MIDITDLEDARQELSPKRDMIAEIPTLAADAIISGGKVIVERRYANSPPDRLCEFSTVAQFSNFWAIFFRKS